MDFNDAYSSFESPRGLLGGEEDRLSLGVAEEDKFFECDSCPSLLSEAGGDGEEVENKECTASDAKEATTDEEVFS